MKNLRIGIIKYPTCMNHIGVLKENPKIFYEHYKRNCDAICQIRFYFKQRIEALGIAYVLL